MATLTALFILMWYEASAPWWVAFWVILALKFGKAVVESNEKAISKFLGE